jgi:RNA polymerase sigma-70 factor (ECF subfamily)
MLTAAETHASADVDLIRRLKAGDEEAYAIVVRTQGGRMLSVARRFLRDEEAARDAVQDAFLSAFRGIHTFDGEAQLATWLHRIVVNAALMKLRTRRRKPEESIEPMLPAFAEDGHHATRPVTVGVSENALKLRLHRARQALATKLQGRAR